MGSRTFMVAFLFLGPVIVSPLPINEADKTDDKGLEIVNGEFTTIDKYPINVAFLIANDIWGAGVILNGLWVLTTAFNCLWLDPSFITLRVGSSNWTEGGEVIAAEECIMHPNYTGNWANNIALVKLASKIKFGPNARQGYYKRNETLNIPNNKYDVSGWGVRSSSFKKEAQLQVISQTITTAEECSKYYNLTAAAGSFCASNPAGGPCVFDFGAPMNWKRTVVGIYQGSKDCTKPDTYPALYVDVFQYIDWITSVIHNRQ